MHVFLLALVMTVHTSNALRGDGLDEGLAFQTVIDAVESDSGGTVYVDNPEKEIGLKRTLRVPRTDFNGNGPVDLVGESMRRTKLQVMPGMVGTRAIGWKAATGASPSSGRWMGWYQRIEGLSISLGFAPIGAAIWFDEHPGAPDVGFRDYSRPVEEWDEYGNPPVTTMPDPRWNKWQGVIKDVLIEGTNRDHDAVIRLDGGIWNTTIENVHLDCALYAPNFDTTLLRVGDGIHAAVDHQGLHACVVKNLSAGMRRGGWGTLFSGRAVGTRFINLNAAVGSVFRPYLRFRNSYKCLIDGVMTEGSGAQPQILVEHCREMTFEDITLGKPTDRGTGVGDGFGFVASEDCFVRDLGAYPNSPAWSPSGVKRVRLDSRSHRNHITVSLSGVDTPANAIVDEGQQNTIYAKNVTDGRRWRMHNRQIVGLAEGDL